MVLGKCKDGYFILCIKKTQMFLFGLLPALFEILSFLVSIRFQEKRRKGYWINSWCILLPWNKERWKPSGDKGHRWLWNCPVAQSSTYFKSIRQQIAFSKVFKLSEEVKWQILKLYLFVFIYCIVFYFIYLKTNKQTKRTHWIFVLCNTEMWSQL